MQCEDIRVNKLVITMKMKSYSELIKFDTYEERLNYLYIGDKIGNQTFGNARWINQRFYKSLEWKRVRDFIIMRDGGCDLGIDGCGLSNRNIIVHHINPITEEDIINRNSKLYDPENLISLSLQSHNFIHYGCKLEELPIERSPNDTCPWKK